MPHPTVLEFRKWVVEELNRLLSEAAKPTPNDSTKYLVDTGTNERFETIGTPYKKVSS
jgi:hypothetical protein